MPASDWVALLPGYVLTAAAAAATKADTFVAENPPPVEGTACKGNIKVISEAFKASAEVLAEAIRRSQIQIAEAKKMAALVAAS